jgi:predicted metal-binding protein
MGRPYMDCKGKWKKIKAFNMKKGVFAAVGL